MFLHWIFEFCLKGVEKQKDIEIYTRTAYIPKDQAITPKSKKQTRRG